ncbi:MAG: hypothetical protein IKY38_01390 [Anaerotignum sp.]|nr:hypothetical protein [Anaerotignum sp.]
MKRKELNELKAKISEKKEKATDMDIIVGELMKLPPGQLKKVLTDEVLAVLEKYGYSG